MYRSESTSSSFSSVNGKSRGEMKQSLEEGGLRLKRHIRTKDGKVTKAKERLSKSASAIDPGVMYFFRDELEKQAISPSFSLKHFDAPGIKGRIARGYAKTFSPGGILNPQRVNRLNDVAREMNSPAALAYGPAFGKATVIGTAKKEGLHALRANPRFADAITKIERDIPTHLFPDSYGNAVENLGIVGKALGL